MSLGVAKEENIFLRNIVSYQCFVTFSSVDKLGNIFFGESLSPINVFFSYYLWPNFVSRGGPALTGYTMFPEPSFGKTGKH